MRILWDPGKAMANAAAHEVSFAEAATVFTDEQAIPREDREAIGEQRFALLGRSAEGRVLVVVYTYRDTDVIRIISAWEANRRHRLR